MKRALFLIMITAMLGLSARAAEPSDSLASALATYWGTAVNTGTLSKGELESFVKGFEENFPDTDSLKMQYLRGASLASVIARSLAEAATIGLEVSPERLKEEMVKVLRGASTGFTPAEAQAYIDARVAPETAREFSAESQTEFLTQMAALPGAVTTPSGLIFQVLTEGEGPMPVDGDTVTVSYTGRLSDGSVFDSTDSPIDMSVSGVVPGFSEGLKMMKPGGRYRIIFPASLGYGERGAGGGLIPPGAALDFTVDLIGIK
ncbi:MAG: FKBP-type peptidyl-prolyl cis-trans isomerase [Muribaculaceae bacterium]|nr:FKBP-type peptidyl-prolyl cis-trans isomerase [Muribaculaceae bacterium]